MSFLKQQGCFKLVQCTTEWKYKTT